MLPHLWHGHGIGQVIDLERVVERLATAIVGDAADAFRAHVAERQRSHGVPVGRFGTCTSLASAATMATMHPGGFGECWSLRESAIAAWDRTQRRGVKGA